VRAQRGRAAGLKGGSWQLGRYQAYLPGPWSVVGVMQTQAAVWCSGQGVELAEPGGGGLEPGALLRGGGLASAPPPATARCRRLLMHCHPGCTSAPRVLLQ
jgi:hypothetical protein